jgi:hypothetical protein
MNQPPDSEADTHALSHTEAMMRIRAYAHILRERDCAALSCLSRRDASPHCRCAFVHAMLTYFCPRIHYSKTIYIYIYICIYIYIYLYIYTHTDVQVFHRIPSTHTSIYIHAKHFTFLCHKHTYIHIMAIISIVAHICVLHVLCICLYLHTHTHLIYNLHT